MSTTEIVFAVIAIIATIAPTICNAIAIFFNNKTNIKIEKIKRFDEERIKALNNFIKDSHQFFSSNSTLNEQEMVEYNHSNMIHSFLTLQLYFDLDDTVRQKMFSMERKGGYEEDWKFRNDLIVALSKQINSYIKK